jgi:transketolase
VATDTLTASEVDLDRPAVDTVRVLAMDAIQKAGSGHPGTAMALAPAACVPWTRFLRFGPVDPEWFDRDWFVLSAGHAWCCSMRCCT